MYEYLAKKLANDNEWSAEEDFGACPVPILKRSNHCTSPQPKFPEPEYRDCAVCDDDVDAFHVWKEGQTRANMARIHSHGNGRELSLRNILGEPEDVVGGHHVKMAEWARACVDAEFGNDADRTEDSETGDSETDDEEMEVDCDELKVPRPSTGNLFYHPEIENQVWLPRSPRVSDGRGNGAELKDPKTESAWKELRKHDPMSLDFGDF